MLGECLMASRQVEGLRAQVASDIKATLSEAATPLAVAGLPCGGCPITRFYVIGGARFRRLFLMQSKRHRTRTRVRRRVLSPRRCKAGRPKRAPRRCANRAARKPLSRFPRGKPGRGKFPPRRQHRPAPPARGFSKRSAENPLARSRWGHNGESVQSETMRAAKQESEVFPLAALCLLTENSHQGHRLPTAVLHQGFTPTNSNTATGFAAFLYDSGRRSRSTGKERDAETGLDYFGARYFSGAQGRFTSPDWSAKPEAVPYADLTDPQTLNLYGYVRNNPLARPDVDGHCTDPATCAVEGAAIGEFAGPLGAVAGGVLGAAAGAFVGKVLGEAIVSALPASGGTACGELYCSGSVPFMNENTDRGRANEQKGLDAAGAEKNTTPISATDPKTGKTGTTIPDGKKPDGQLVEVKDAKRVTDSSQQRLQNEASKQSSGKPSEVVTGEKTQVSKTIQREHPVRRIKDLGPQ